MIIKNCAFCGQEFANRGRAAKYCCTDCYHKAAASRPHRKKEIVSKRPSQIDTKLKESNGKYAELQKAETIRLYGRVIIEAS